MTTSFPPPPPAFAPGTSAPQAHWQRGPVGTPRSTGLWILLAVVTLGIACAVWTWKAHEEIKRYDGQGVGGWVGLLIYIVFSPITFFLLASEVQKLHELDGVSSPVTTKTGCWVFLPIIGAIVWYVKVQSALNDFWVRRGAPPA